MDPITLIVTALATGAAAGLKPTAEKAIKDAYEGLKALIVRRYERTNAAVPVLEHNPASDAGKAVLQEALAEEGAAEDETLLRQAQAVLQAVHLHDASAAAAAGVLIEDIEAGASVNVRDIVSDGSFTARKIRAREDVTIEGVRAGRGGEPPGKAGGPGALRHRRTPPR
jgi:hypothetical protein